MREKHHHAAKGESMVWLTGMGLAVGIAMITGLLVVILVNGMEAFWPRRVAELQLNVAPAESPVGSTTVAGEIVHRQEKRFRAVREGEDPSMDPPREWQLFVGNKDAYGLSFVFVNLEAVDAVEYPKSILVMERKEYGDAIGYPVHLERSDSAPLVVDDPIFNETLRRLVEESVERWGRIEEIEKKEIGAINRKMERLEYDKRDILRENENVLAGPSEPEKRDAYRVRAERGETTRREVGRDR